MYEKCMHCRNPFKPSFLISNEMLMVSVLSITVEEAAAALTCPFCRGTENFATKDDSYTEGCTVN